MSQAACDLENADKSPRTIRAYRSDLAAFVTCCPPEFGTIDASHLRQFFADHRHLKPATRARKQTFVASFLKWGYQHNLIDANPMLKIDRVQVSQDQHITVMGKGRRQRTILLDDPSLVLLLKQYLDKHGYQHGSLFRAHKNYRGGPLRYQSAQEKWEAYCQQAGVTCTLHQLRHAYAAELVNDGVRLATIRKRLGHKHIQTTLRYARLSDATADAEIRAWRRRKQ